MKIFLRISSLLFLLISLVTGMLFCIETYKMKDHLIEYTIHQIESVVKTTIIEFIPQYDYQEHNNTEMLYQWTKKAVSGVLFPFWEYQEQYGEHGDKIISENTVPSFLYSENEETEQIADDTEQKKRTFTNKQLYSQSYLRKYFIQVDSTTTITNQELNGKELFSKDLTVDDGDSPQILIYHTHGSESYADSRKGKKTDTVMGVGDELTKELEKQGFSVIHDKSSYDIRNGKLDRSKAYSYAAAGIEKMLNRYPQIQVIIDLHRDGVASGTRLVANVDGEKTAQVMFFNGVSRTATNGNIVYLKNPNKLWNLAFSLQMQKAAYEKYPGFTRKIYIKGYRYNLHYRKRSMLVEVGAQTNTVSEAKRAMKPLADIIAAVLK
ncbi:MAG: stage II sporulation protein P [Lachnospiraceae bacterium]|nr:stage II sporulation protein P [Lachnospiraceae bacterium]